MPNRDRLRRTDPAEFYRLERLNEERQNLVWSEATKQSGYVYKEFTGMEDRTIAYIDTCYAEEEPDEGDVAYWLHGTVFRTNDIFRVAGTGL